MSRLSPAHRRKTVVVIIIINKQIIFDLVANDRCDQSERIVFVFHY